MQSLRLYELGFQAIFACRSCYHNPYWHLPRSCHGYRSGCSSRVHAPLVLTFIGGYKPLVQSFILGRTMEQARNFAVMTGVNAGISCVMKRLRGKEDMQTRFGSGVMVSLVSGMRGPSVTSIGVLFAVVNCAMLKLEEQASQQQAKDIGPNKTKGMFSSIGIGFGLDHYPMNPLTRGMLTQNTIPLHIDSCYHNPYWRLLRSFHGYRCGCSLEGACSVGSINHLQKAAPLDQRVWFQGLVPESWYHCIGIGFGLDHYPMNPLNRGMLTENTIPLHTDRNGMRKGGSKAWLRSS
ncbi:hypothetical protein CTI12_AA167820 [Artemisia annua]|uniref:Uncharacterized protein n=1 Tax=Artemisia annua TaxID=35608 RepID=A0A2U1P4N5_ARTAN|nr:hypothetical protein CTI12_AA167820 [Artemisia annua]